MQLYVKSSASLKERSYSSMFFFLGIDDGRRNYDWTSIGSNQLEKNINNKYDIEYK